MSHKFINYLSETPYMGGDFLEFWGINWLS